MVVPATIVVCIGEGFFKEVDGRGSCQDEIIDRGAGFHTNDIIESVRTGSVRENNLGRASIGAEFRGARDAHERLGAWIGFDQAHSLQLAVVGESVGDLQRMQEVRHVVEEIGERNGQLVEGVVDVVSDGEVVAALVHEIAVGAVLRAGDAEGEALLQ